MADYDLKYTGAQIDALLDAANELKTNGYIYKGVATPSTNPGTPTERVAYLASEPGTYTNFAGIVIASGLYSLTYAGGTWTGTQMSAGSDIEVVQTTGQSTSDVMSQKAVTDEIMTPPQSWDLSYGGDFTWELGTIHDDGKAYSSSSYYHLYIPVSDLKGWKVKIKAQSTIHAIYTLLKNIGFAYPVKPLNISSYYCEGYSNIVTIPAGEAAEITIPDDCNYIYIGCGQISGQSYPPESGSYYTHKWGDVVQTTGQSTSSVMSQKAVTDELKVPVELYQGTIDNGQILSNTKRLYTNVIKTPCYIKARDGYHIAGIARYGDNSRDIFLGSDWDITLNERNVNDFGYCSFVITKGNSSQVITPDEDCIESFYNMLSYSGYEIVPVSKNTEILQNANFDMPFLGYGRKVISRPTDTYAHAASVDITSDYMFISYHSSAYKTVESFVNNAMILYVLKLSDASVRYIDMFNDRSLEKIDGNVISKVYNQSVAVLNNQKILMRTGCNMDGKWQLIGRTYDANLNELSAPFVEKLSYNGMTVDFTLSNWWSMCNTLYGTSLSDIARTDSNEIAGICRSGNYYYTVHAFYHQINEVIPTVLLKSLDAITWEPVACLTKNHVNSETAITALNNKLYIAFRNNNNGTFYMVTDMNGNVLQDWTSTGGGISSRPSIASAGGKIYIAYNHATGNSKHFGRNGLTISEINQTSYELTTLKTWKSNNGYNYFAITPTINQNLIIANVEDFRGYNYANNQNATTDINIAEIELL